MLDAHVSISGADTASSRATATAAQDAQPTGPPAAAVAAGDWPAGDPCELCDGTMREPVYPMLGDGSSCDGHAEKRHWCCRTCLVRQCLQNTKTCPTCRRGIVQMMTLDGPVALPEPTQDDEPGFCEVCSGVDQTDNDRLFLCDHDGCDVGFHQQCIRPKMTPAAAQALAEGPGRAWCTRHAPVRPVTSPTLLPSNHLAGPHLSSFAHDAGPSSEGRSRDPVQSRR